MSARRSWSKVMVLVLAAIMLLSLPLAAGAAPANEITAPKDGATVSGTVDVVGYANDPNFQKWQLDLLPGGDPNAAIFLALGNKPGDFSYALDTRGFPDGQHALRLRVVRSDSNYSEYTNKFTIANVGAKPAATPAATSAVTLTATSAITPTATSAITPTATSAVTLTATSAVTPTMPSAPAAAKAPAMANGITNLKDGAKISGSAEIKGYANDPSFLKWQLDLLPGGDPNAAIFLALGNNSGDFSYTVDTTKFPNGDHALRLRVVRSDSNYSEYITKFSIANH